MPPHSLLKAALNLTSRLESMASWPLTCSILHFGLVIWSGQAFTKPYHLQQVESSEKNVVSELGELHITFFPKNCLYRWLFEKWILHTVSYTTTDNAELQVPVFFNMCCGDCFLLHYFSLHFRLYDFLICMDGKILNERMWKEWCSVSPLGLWHISSCLR